MGIGKILDFVKVEHTLFSLPFVLIGAILATSSPDFSMLDILWILVAAVGARGLAMTLNRIIDKDIDAANPRTAERHLAAGGMEMSTAWYLSATFLFMLLIAASLLNEVALYLSWMPVLAFIIYPFLKRVTWLCHLWLGLCLALAPAGAWLAIEADTYGWAAFNGLHDGYSDMLWYPEIFWISLGVAFWITAFDINYARLDIENDREQGIHSFPAHFGIKATRNMSIILTVAWILCFYQSGIHNPSDVNSDYYPYWIYVTLLMGIANIIVMTVKANTAHDSENDMRDYQTILFRTSMLTGWILLLSLSVKL
ncbi:MAG TPA: 4-hydroxybenzoate octaprenyltransferase [Candidatus Poseidoniales archaeon]|nr:4-hydroxybenzoate octaprenyltransferase [Candidatus Poseidoniales archaeon]